MLSLQHMTILSPQHMTILSQHMTILSSQNMTILSLQHMTILSPLHMTILSPEHMTILSPRHMTILGWDAPEEEIVEEGWGVRHLSTMNRKVQPRILIMHSVQHEGRPDWRLGVRVWMWILGSLSEKKFVNN